MRRKIENPLYDITANRHGANQESAEANAKIANGKGAARMRVLRFAIERGSKGITTDEAAEHFALPPNAVSGRISELKALKMLISTNERRETRSGCKARVLVAAGAKPPRRQQSPRPVTLRDPRQAEMFSEAAR